MNMVGSVKVNMNPINRILKDKGLTAGGDVQRFHTSKVNRRIGKYMPHRSGALETKLKHVKSDTEIEVLGPYAKYQYYGVAMEGKPPMVPTACPLKYTKTFNPHAGPFWDRALVTAEGAVLQRELQSYINRRAGKR